jgi:S-adenosylmethionine decarboxylase
MIAPDIFRKRLLIEGYFTREIVAATLEEFFRYITRQLSLRTYADPIIHTTGGAGKQENEGYDAFVPLIDSGIYIAVWSTKKFLSIVMYTCKEFDEQAAVDHTVSFFGITESEHKLF